LRTSLGLWLLLAAVILPTPSLADDAAPPQFYRGVDLNGSAITLDGHAWDGNDAANFRCNGNSFSNDTVELKPKTDPVRAQMIHSSRWGREIDVELLNVPAATYQVFLYVWEDTDSTTFDVLVNDRPVLKQFKSGAAGTWSRLGPWRAEPRDGVLKVSARGGDANLSGLEVWSGVGAISDPTKPAFNTKPTEEQLAFFESRIRPLLIKHCYECHGQEATEIAGGLLLDSHAGIVRGGDNGAPIVPGDPDSSLLIKAVRQTDESLTMPPEDKLSDLEIADLENWVRMGAPDARTEDTVAAVKAKVALSMEQARDFWSLKPIDGSKVPVVNDQAWVANEIDRFVLAKLEEVGLSPARDAEKRTLIRRATFDLTGLPPTPEEIDAFLADSSPEAFSKVVDRLLESPRYGERWGRHWLDVVRYSDTAGDNSDFPIPQMFKYRNWVIEAFNRDLPYDRFVREQLAGDLMPAETVEETQSRIVATGYIANARRFGSRVDDYPQHLTIEDTIDNLGRTFLATTINCARCHNHKFDPVSTEDYYALYGIFHSTRYPWPGIELEQKQRDLVEFATQEEVSAAMKAREESQKPLDEEVKRLEKAKNDAQGDEKKALEKELEQAKDRARQNAGQPLPYETAYAVAEGSAIEDSRVQIKGDPAKTGPMVHRGFPDCLGGQELSPGDTSSGRLQLADWIVDRNNTLTARVMVNRIWLHHFGRGIVPTANDFGRQGKPPTHPELLDWLAARFMDSGWSVKSMHRLIMLSHAYRVSGERDAKSFEVDPSNDRLGAFPRNRLDAEAIRDTLLALGGTLDLSPGGEHPFPPQSEWKFTQHNPFKAVYDTNRRSVYLMTQRIQRHPYLAVFDGADPSASTPMRLTSTTPLQALYLLNNPLVHEQAAAFAKRLIEERADDAARIDRAYQLALGRPAGAEEVAAGLEFLSQSRGTLQQTGTGENEVDAGAWQAFARVVFRLNEFVYVD
jgi:hypothetical protein